jgi:GNAT superfamily N-acetyltransferase
MNSNITIHHFRSEDQVAAKALILRGMEEHWGVLDLSMNSDLNDIATSYADGIFLVAFTNGELVGTGALVREANETGRIVRMSVAREIRRQGVATKILNALCHEARQLGYQRLVLGTEAAWTDAVTFYKRFGFTTVGLANNGHQFALTLLKDE